MSVSQTAHEIVNGIINIVNGDQTFYSNTVEDYRTNYKNVISKTIDIIKPDRLPASETSKSKEGPLNDIDPASVWMEDSNESANNHTKNRPFVPMPTSQAPECYVADSEKTPLITIVRPYLAIVIFVVAVGAVYRRFG